MEGRERGEERKVWSRGPEEGVATSMLWVVDGGGYEHSHISFARSTMPL